MKIRLILPLFFLCVFALTACQSKNMQEVGHKATGTSGWQPFYGASEPQEKSESNSKEQIDFEEFKEYLLDGKNVETVFCFSDGRDIIQPIVSSDTISLSIKKDDDGERKVASIIAEYLRERSMFKEKPDSINTIDDICSIEY